MYLSNETYIKDIEKTIEYSNTDFLRNKSVFITGSSGLVGSFFVDILRYLNKTQNYNIKIYATFSSQKSFQKRFPNSIDESNFIPVIWDIQEPIKLDLKPDYIIHAASNTHPKLYACAPVETMKLNFLGTMNVLDFAKNNKNCRTVFLSTLEIYGENPAVTCFKEDDYGFVDFRVLRSCYPESKRACETLCQAYFSEYSLDIITARLGYIFGPTVNLESSKADVQFLNNVLKGQDIILKSKGEQKRSYCYVADVASALFTLLKKGKSGEAYNIANKNSNIQLKDFASAIAEIASANVIFQLPSEIEEKGGSKVQNSILSSKKIEKLGWHPIFNLYESIKHTVEIKRGVYCV